MSFSSSSPPFQPFQEFPASASSQEASRSASTSGSYAQVLIVLGIIFVVSIAGCVVGRICFKDGECKAKQKLGGSKKKGKQGKLSQGFQPNDIDLEFGFEHKLKPIPSDKISVGDGFNRAFQPLGMHGSIGSGSRGPGHMEFKNTSGSIPYSTNTDHMKFNHGSGSIHSYNHGPMEFRHGPGPIPYTE